MTARRDGAKIEMETLNMTAHINRVTFTPRRFRSPSFDAHLSDNAGNLTGETVHVENSDKIDVIIELTIVGDTSSDEIATAIREYLLTRTRD